MLQVWNHQRDRHVPEVIWLNPGCFDPFQQIHVDEEQEGLSAQDRSRAMKQYVFGDAFFMSFQRRLQEEMISGEWLAYYSFERRV